MTPLSATSPISQSMQPSTPRIVRCIEPVPDSMRIAMQAGPRQSAILGS